MSQEGVAIFVEFYYSMDTRKKDRHLDDVSV